MKYTLIMYMLLFPIEICTTGHLIMFCLSDGLCCHDIIPSFW